MLIREATAEDWPRIWPFWHRLVAAGETCTWDPDTSEEAARALWMAPAKRVYAAQDATGAVVGSAYLTPNYGGPAAGVANAGFMVDPDHGGRGIGRALADHVLAEAKADGYRGMVFNAVVETNPAVRLWTSLGFTVLDTVPEAYEHPRHGPVGLRGTAAQGRTRTRVRRGNTVRVALHTKVRADRVEEREAAHREVPEELTDAVRAAGVTSWTIAAAASPAPGSQQNNMRALSALTCEVKSQNPQANSLRAHSSLQYCPTCQTGGKPLADRRMSRLLK